MNKSRQKELTRWLKQQSVISQRWLNISRLLGFVSGILIISQAWFMARILQHMIMENIPREALLLPFTLLFLTFVLRGMGGLVTRTGGLSRRAAYPLCHPPSGSRPSATSRASVDSG
ncbi:ABC transporter ATP-binding protein/permease [Escherichia coli]|uniref:ABC transporter ATP-binding protein/permease n=1 Tax=Escherichia coli TaxID=562 RepID=A0A484WSE8_ECOLX|nr:ABC transporter ATP-binding protein/permease [Escherichia coli]